jgi:lactoylglutathione lyase
MSATAAHMMLRVRDEATSVAFYRAAFGLEIAERADFETFTLIYMRNANSPFEVELTVNKDRSAPYNLGDGSGHIAFVVDDLEAEHARISAAGLAPRDIKSMALGSKPFARFFFIDDPDGYKIEVIERGGRFA